MSLPFGRRCEVTNTTVCTDWSWAAPMKTLYDAFCSYSKKPILPRKDLAFVLFYRVIAWPERVTAVAWGRNISLSQSAVS